MKFDKWIGLIRTSEVFTGLVNCKRIVGAVSHKADNYLRSIQERSLFFRETGKIRTWFESFRQRRDGPFWESMDRRWGKVIEVGIILLIALMPVLNSWGILLALDLILYIIRFPERKLPDTGLSLFWLALAFSALMAVGTEGLGRMGAVTVWLLIAGLTGRIFTARFSRKVMDFLPIAGLIWMIIGLWQQAAGVLTPAHWLETGQSLLISVRSYSVFGNPNIYGLYLLSILILALSGIRSQARFVRAVSLAALTLGPISLYFTYSRTAWLLGIAALILGFDKGFYSYRQSYLWIGILLLLNLPGFRARVTGPENFSESTLGFRMQIWRSTLKVIADYWRWGSGPGSFSEVYGSYPMGNCMVPHGHQLYLQLWLENGFISLAAFIRVMVKSLSGFTSLPRRVKGVALVIVMFLAAGFMETWWVHQFLGGYFWLLVGLLQSMRTGQIGS